MRLKKLGAANSLALTCSLATCKAIWWIPKFVRSAEALPEQCARCLQTRHAAVCKMRLRFNLATAPPGTAPEQDCCPACDPLWRSSMSDPLQLRQGSAPAQVQGQGQGQGRRV
ncbi:hypothetical protein B484DRAFT_440585, partial [Ochromonadaceae sp. CCMP2298]